MIVTYRLCRKGRDFSTPTRTEIETLLDNEVVPLMKHLTYRFKVRHIGEIPGRVGYAVEYRYAQLIGLDVAEELIRPDPGGRYSFDGRYFCAF